MDEVKRIEKEKVKDIPPVPIKTYKWEEIRREKKKGRYPYTHLRKGPYNEEIDPAEFRMDTLRTSKSASTLEKSSSGVDIQDVTGKEVNSGGKDYLDVYNEGIVETADSSNEDNVSQYLDKDEDAPIIMEHIEVPGPSKKEEKMDVDDDREEQRAKSEEPKRKRKLSIESSYSRISLSKLGVMKKLREAKEKLKLPKFNFSKSESKLDIPKKSKKEDKKEKTGKKALQAYFEPKKHDTPVYIHIPLKPPPGETDEFSYLEFEDSKAEPSTSVAPSTPEKTEQENINGVQQPNGKEGVQFIILTAPSDDETLENHGSPDTPSSETGKKFFETVKLKDLKTLAKECVDEITPDMPIEGIIFEDVIQVEYVDEHNRSLGTTERSNILEITEENLPNIERQLSQRNLAKELQKDIASSMDSLHHIARQNTLKKLKQQQKSKSNEALKKARDFPKKTQEAPELTISPPPITKPDEEQSKLAESVQEVEKMDAVETVIANIDKVKSEKDEEIKIDKSEETESKTIETREKKEIQKQPDAEAATKVKTEAMYDEEDGLKLSETAVQMINEELAKEQLPKTNEEQLKAAAAKPTSVKKKVSFKRRSKQEDPDGVYEDVRVTSDNKKVNGKEQQTKELKVMEPSQSMSAEEEKTYLDDKIMKTTSLEEDYNKWSKLTYYVDKIRRSSSDNFVQYHTRISNTSFTTNTSYSSPEAAYPSNHDTPVYIHIPLKPPPGETDEFSYLEFEDSKAEPSTSVAPSTPEKTEQENINGVQQPNGKEGVQFIILTAPSDDETLENHGSPDTPSSETGKKFFETVKLKDLKTLAKECVDEITPDMPIEGIIFEDVIQVEYVDEHNRSLGTTERSNILEITEENLPNIERQLSQRNLAKELQKDIASSMDSLHHIARQNTLKKLKQQQKSKSNEALKKARDFPKKTQEAPELTISPPPITKPDEEQSKLAESVQEVEKMDAVETVIANIDKVKSEKDEEIKIDKSEETESKTIETREKKEIQKQPDAEAATKVKTEAMYDEEDGLKLSETAVQMINEELAKEQLPKTNEEQLKAAAAKPTSVKKKVSFKRRSKQEDPDGVYEDVRVTSDNKKVNGKEQQTKELKVMEPSQSMSAEEEKTYLDDKIMKTTSLEEDYNKWSKLTDHEYEPVNPPAEVESQQPPAPEVPPNDASVKRTSSKQSKKSPSNSIRISLKGEDVVQNEEDIESGDALTVEEMQARIEDQFFNKESPSSQPADLPVNTTSVQLTTDNKENVPQESQAKKIQGAFRAQAEKLRTKMKNIKKPNIHMPQRPKFEKFKIQKPNITMPKIPDQMRVNLPSFTLPKRGSRTEKRPVKQYSTESNVGDSKKKLFDFSTYPRIFKRKKKPDDFDNDEFDISATVPRSTKTSKGRQRNSEKTKESEKKKKSPDVIRIPLHSEESMDKDENNMSSHRRYEEENIDMDDAYLKESQQMNVASAIHASDFNRNRWNHGSFHGHNPNETENNENEIKDVTMDNEIDRPQTSPEPELEIEMDSEQIQSDMRSVSSSGDVHGPGVLEKINSDEYFMQMGGNYLSAEIREAFKQPTNPLAKLQADDSFEREFDISDQSIQDVPKRKPIRKPKRKKTPNVSRERIPYDQESEQEEYPEPYNEQPARPTRRSKQKKKTDDDKPPYQETIFVQDPQFEIMRKAASDNILLVDRGDNNGFRDGHFRQEYPKLYENEKMQGIDQPNIFISDPYQKRGFRYHEDDNQNLGSYEKETPDAPPRRQRSLRSLGSEHDSIIDEYNLPKQDISQNIEVNKLEYEYIIPTPEEPPIRPTRTKSRTRSQSRTTDQPEDELPPTLEPETPCIEEPCVQQVCDYMGYAVIDKNRHREPPLPPPTRKKRSNTKPETKFFTVPRPLKEEVPKRPVRNYSTLVPKSQRPPLNLSEEEKENVDIGQYIEIEDEDEHSRLQSGEIVQKMKGRPLPAPPRPPRKCKDSDKDSPFKDITHENNLDEEEPTKMKLEEAEASVQTEPLPDDVVCEELVEEKGDKIIIPTTSKFHPPITEFENIETVTHGTLVVTPIPEDFQEGPITSFSRSTERIITVRREYDEDDSKTPEDFRTLRDPQPKIIERIIERPVQGSPEIELLRAQKLQVSDLDVDRLMVNELLASKIKVSEIDGETISVAEINPKSGNLMIGGLELPVSLIQDIIEKIRNSQIPTEIQRESAGENRDKILIEGKDPSAHPEFLTDDSKNADVPSGKSQQPQEPHEPFKENLPPNLPTKTHEDIVPSKEEDEPSKRISPDPEKNILFEPDSELSPTTLKNTIEYLDNLIIEESSKSDLENNAKREKQSDLEAMPDSKPEVFTTEVSTKVKSITLPPIDPYSEEEHESIDLQEIPLLIPDTSEEEKLIEELKITSSEQKKTPFEEEIGQPPTRPPRQSDIHRLQQSHEEIFIPSQIIENSHNIILGDSTPPPRPPDPEERLYLRSQPPPSFYVLRTPALDGFVDEDIPLPPRRKRPQRQPSQSSSEEALRTTPRSRRHRTPEPSIPQLAGQLTRACVLVGERAFKRLVKHVTMNVLRNADGKQDLHVMILILLVLIAGLILLGNGGSPIVHHYHWEYFNPPRDL